MSVRRIIRHVFLTLLLFSVGCASKAGDDHSAYAPEHVSYNDLVKEIASRKGHVVIVNFWATWCMPCRIEFPDFVRFGKEFEDKGVDVVFVSTDYEPDMPHVIDFLKENEVPWHSYIKTGVDMDFISSFHSEWSGALPATFVYDKNGSLRAFWEGLSSFDELEDSVSAILES